NVERIQQNLDNSLMLVTALTPHIGYDSAAEIAKHAHKNRKTLREAAVELGHLTRDEFERLGRPEKMAKPDGTLRGAPTVRNTDRPSRRGGRMAIYDAEVEALDGSPADLADYKGKALLIVNVASQCGLTPQYTGLQALHEEYADHGFAVLGFPCNQFG